MKSSWWVEEVRREGGRETVGSGWKMIGVEAETEDMYGAVSPGL